MKPIIVANWKMHKTNAEVKDFLAHLQPVDGVELWIAPPLTALALAATYSVWVGAQCISSEAEGAFTGEVSAKQVASAGARFVLVGHSERRRRLGETSEMISRQITLAVENNLVPVLCVGETLQERESGKTEAVLQSQVIPGFAGVIAYEPIWAIGTGKTPTVEMIAQAHALCKSICPTTPVLYGGSVNRENAAAFAQITGVDGLLVGGASLDVESFMAIAKGFIA